MFLSLKNEASNTCLSEGVLRFPLLTIAAGWAAPVVFPTAGS